MVMSEGKLKQALKAVERVLAGEIADSVESETLDFKEDPTRRDGRGGRLRGSATSDPAARILADAAACMANGEGGVIVVGVNDKAFGQEALVGAALDAEWLCRRLGELTQPRLVVSAKEIEAGTPPVRLLVLFIPRNAGDEPHSALVSRKGGRRVSRRVGTDCHEMATLAEMMAWAQERKDFDWSVLPGDNEITDARAGAVEVLREFLRQSNEPSRVEMADLDDETLMQRLQLVREGGTMLTRAGELLLCPAESPRIVYYQREQAGMPSKSRVVVQGRSLVEELDAVLAAIDTANPITEIESSGDLARGFARAIPMPAIREALINAIMHRDWGIAEPIVVDHVGSGLSVFSPGTFLAGITPQTVLTAPSRTRNRLLGRALRSLRLAEREGTGVDRMYVEMVRLGHRPPVFEERDGGVRVSLNGGPPVKEVIATQELIPQPLRSTARTAVLIDLLRKQPSVSQAELAAAAQEDPSSLDSFIAEAEAAEILVRTGNPRPGGEAAWRLADPLRERLGPVLPYYARPLDESIRQIKALVGKQGSIRNADVQDLLGVSSTRASQLLAAAEGVGAIQLAPGAKRRGRSAYFIATKNKAKTP